MVSQEEYARTLRHRHSPKKKCVIMIQQFLSYL